MIRRSWMRGTSIETTLELWASSLREIKARMRPLFTQERVAGSEGLFLDGLLGAERRKTGLPPEKWSSLKYGLWPDGGQRNAKEETQGGRAVQWIDYSP